MTIPIAAQATSSHIVHVVRNTKLTTLVIDKTHLEYILRLIEGTSITHIIIIGDGEQDYSEQEKYFGCNITCLNRLKNIGKEHLIDKSEKISKDITHLVVKVCMTQPTFNASN